MWRSEFMTLKISYRGESALPIVLEPLEAGARGKKGLKSRKHGKKNSKKISGWIINFFLELCNKKKCGLRKNV